MAANQAVSDLTADILRALADKLSSDQVANSAPTSTQQQRRPNVSNDAKKQTFYRQQPHFIKQQQQTNVRVLKTPLLATPNQSPSQHQQQQQKAGAVVPKAVVSRLTPKEVGLGKIRNNEKVLILMRGCPGSGKTTLARQMQHRGVIYSADDYFIRDGQYEFEPTKLKEAHAHVQNWCLRAMESSRSPIIIDNTNLHSWEMKPYVNMALEHRYFILLLEPETHWRYNAAQLTSKNTHQIGFTRIVRMLDDFDRSVTVSKLIKSCRVIENQAMAPSRSTQLPFNSDTVGQNKFQRTTPRKPRTKKANLQRNMSKSKPDINQPPADESNRWSSDDEAPTTMMAPRPTNLRKGKSVPDMLHQIEALHIGRSSPVVPVRTSPQKVQQQNVSNHMPDVLGLNYRYSKSTN